VLISFEAKLAIQSEYCVIQVVVPCQSIYCSKFPENPDATCAFQKVSVAYDILSDASKKKNYDLQTTSQRQQFDFFSTRPHAEDTLRSVLLGVFNDFLEGDLEIVRTFLSRSFPQSSTPVANESLFRSIGRS
jgi:DnaJ-class molecular chaperone